MDYDLILVVGLVIGILTVPSMLSAWVDGRAPRGSAVTVLSSDDPIRVFQRFSTLHALSDGRAEVIVGRGSFTESFPLFGHALEDYEILFEEKLDLFTKLLRDSEVTWQGQTRPPLTRQRVFPTLAQPLPVWVGVGGSPESFRELMARESERWAPIIRRSGARID